MTAKKRLTLTVDAEVYDAVDRFSRAQGRTKSDVFNEIMLASVASLNNITSLYYRAQTMSKSELEELKKSISTLGDFAEDTQSKTTARVLSLVDSTPI